MKDSSKTFYSGCIFVFIFGLVGILMARPPINMAYMSLGLGATFAILLALSRIEAAIRKED